jgi:MFS family permease
MSIFKNKAFIFLLAGCSLAFSIFFIRLILISWYILEETDSTFLIGLLSGLPAIFNILLAPYGGKLADRFSRKHIFFIFRALSIVIFLSMALSITYNFNVMLIILVTSIFMGAFIGLEGPSARLLIADILGKEKIIEGNAAQEFFNQFLNATLPAIAGFLLTILSITLMFWSLPIIALLSSICALITLLIFKENKKDENLQSSDDSSIRDAIRYSYKNIQIRCLLICSLSMLVWGVTQPLIPEFSRDKLGLEGSGYAILSSVYFVGAMISSISLQYVKKYILNSKSILLFIVLYGFSVILFFISPNFYVAGIMILLSGLFHAYWWAGVLLSLQIIPDERFKGRVISFFFSTLGLVGIGFIIGGFLGTKFSSFIVAISSTSLLLIIHFGLYLFSSSFRSLNSYKG